MSSPLRIGLVGCGRVAERGYVPALRRAGGVELVAVADVEPARCAAVAPGVPAFDSASSLIAEAQPEAVIVATPPWTHLPVARLAVAAGLPALVEKPPAADVSQARELAALDPAPWIGFNRRFEPSLQRLRACIPASGRLALELEFTYERRAWGAHAGSGDALLDVGAHLVDLACWLTGSEVVAVGAGIVEERQATVRLELDRGAIRIVVASDRPYRERFEVRDGRGKVVGRHVAGGLPRRLLARLRPSREHLLVPSLTAQLEAFAAAVRGEPAPLLGTALDGLAVMEAIDAARRSSECQ